MRALRSALQRLSSPELLFSALGARLLVWIGITYAFLPDVIFSGNRIGATHDEHYFLMHEEVARRTILEFLQLPVWNPFFCGGIPELANPQSTFLAPDFIFRLLAGTVVGRKLAILFMMVVGMEGTYRLSRRWKNSALGSILAAIVFSTSGWFSEFIRIGWLNFFTGCHLLPWAILFFSQAVERRHLKKCIGAAAIIAWMLFCGGTYTVPYAVVTLFVLSVFYTWIRLKKRPWRMHVFYTWQVFAAVGIVSVGLGAIRLIPLANLLISFPRRWYAPEQNSVWSLVRVLLGQDVPGLSEMQIGGISFALMLFGVLMFDRLSRRYFLMSVLFLLIAAGNFAPWSPYALIDHMPVFEDLRRPEGYTVVLALFWSLGSGRGLSLLEHYATKSLRMAAWVGVGRLLWLRTTAQLSITAVMLAIGTYVVADAIDSRKVTYGSVFRDAPIHRYQDEFRQTIGNRWDAHVWPFISRGTLACFEETPFPQAADLRGDLSAEEYPLDETLASVTRKRWTPHRIDLDVNARKATTIIVNQNYNTAWRSTVGKAFSLRQRLAVRVPRGSYQMSIVYRDSLVYLGAFVSLLTLSLCLMFMIPGALQWFCLGLRKRRGTLRDSAAMTPPNSS